jgi:hypothetical protein
MKNNWKHQNETIEFINNYQVTLCKLFDYKALNDYYALEIRR